MKFSWLAWAAAVSVAWCAPRAKPPAHTVFDQKQHGDYNIQLHLKDFQIIALLSDESLAGLGDYDYNYDYADFTVKPGLNASTAKPTGENATQKPSIATEQATTISPTVLPPRPNATNAKPPTTVAPQKTTQIPEANATTLRGLTESPDKIKVQIIETPVVPNVAIVPSDDVAVTSSFDENQPLGEILHYRRCGVGFARDKKGKCRRLRRPFDISRLASSLAAKFRQISSEETNLPDASRK